MSFKQTPIAIACLVLSSLTPMAGANEVTVYTDPPSPSEILEHFGEKVFKTRGIKTRSISFQSVPPIPESSAKYNPAQSMADADSATVNAPSKRSKSSVAFSLSFAINSAELSAQAKNYIDAVVEALKIKPNIFVHVSGHTDKSGTYRRNKELSLQRAEAVQGYLASQGIDPARVSISGEAADFPLNTSNPYAPENRRVQFDRIK